MASGDDQFQGCVRAASSSHRLVLAGCGALVLLVILLDSGQERSVANAQRVLEAFQDLKGDTFERETSYDLANTGPIAILDSLVTRYHITNITDLKVEDPASVLHFYPWKGQQSLYLPGDDIKRHMDSPNSIKEWEEVFSRKVQTAYMLPDSASFHREVDRILGAVANAKGMLRSAALETGRNGFSSDSSNVRFAALVAGDSASIDHSVLSDVQFEHPEMIPQDRIWIRCNIPIEATCQEVANTTVGDWIHKKWPHEVVVPSDTKRFLALHEFWNEIRDQTIEGAYRRLEDHKGIESKSISVFGLSVPASRNIVFRLGPIVLLLIYMHLLLYVERAARLKNPEELHTWTPAMHGRFPALLFGLTYVLIPVSTFIVMALNAHGIADRVLGISWIILSVAIGYRLIIARMRLLA